MSSIVIVHGSYHRPAHYDPIAVRLRDRGHQVLVPDVGGLELPDSTAALQELVDGLPAPPVVVGHSFGGAAVGALRGAQRMVFLCAWVLDAGETCTDLLRDAAGGEAFARALRPTQDGTHFSIDPEQAGPLFYADCDPADTARAVGLLRPDTAANFGLPPSAAHWHDTPSLYVRATADRTWPVGLPELFAARCARTTDIDTGHSPFLSRPDEVADLIDTPI